MHFDKEKSLEKIKLNRYIVHKSQYSKYRNKIRLDLGIYNYDRRYIKYILTKVA